MFFFVALSYCSSYIDLTPPFDYNSLNEFGNWSLFGSASPMRNKIRFTGRTLAKTPALCQILPTTCLDWSVSFNVSFKTDDPKNPSVTCFYYSKEICPVNDNSIDTGFSVCISSINQSSTSKINSENVSNHKNVFLIDNKMRDINLDDLQPKCSINSSAIKTNNREETVVFTLEKVGNRINLRIGDDFNCFKYETVPNLPSLGFFSFSVDGNNPTFYVDLNSVIFLNLSSSADLEDLVKYREFNRKLLSVSTSSAESYENRRLLKNERRSQMKNISHYLVQQSDHNFTLDGQNVTLRDAFAEIKEMERRAEQSLEIKNLEYLIQIGTHNGLQKAMLKLNTTAEMLSKVRENFNNLQKSIKSELASVNYEAEIEFNKLRTSAKSVIEKSFKNSETDQFINKFIDKSTSTVKAKGSSKSLFYLAACAVETVGFAAFIWHKRKTTKIFTKAD